MFAMRVTRAREAPSFSAISSWVSFDFTMLFAASCFACLFGSIPAGMSAGDVVFYPAPIGGFNPILQPSVRKIFIKFQIVERTGSELILRKFSGDSDHDIKISAADPQLFTTSAESFKEIGLSKGGQNNYVKSKALDSKIYGVNKINNLMLTQVLGEAPEVHEIVSY